jgi:hypothetical protein
MALSIWRLCRFALALLRGHLFWRYRGRQVKWMPAALTTRQSTT